MEDDLDEIAGGRQQRVPWLHQFWFGNGTPGVKGLKDKALEEADAEAINTIPLGVDDNGEPIVRAQRPLRPVPQARRGHRVACPRTCRSTSSPSTGPSRSCPRPRAASRSATTRTRACRCSRRAAASAPTCSSATPTRCRRTRSRRWRRCSRRCPCRRSPSTRPSRLLQLPRVVGAHPDDGGEIVAANGRYGPFLKWGDETRSLDTEEQLLTVSLDEAVEGPRRAQEVRSPQGGAGARR